MGFDPSRAATVVPWPTDAGRTKTPQTSSVAPVKAAHEDGIAIVAPAQHEPVLEIDGIPVSRGEINGAAEYQKTCDALRGVYARAAAATQKV